MDYPKLTKEQFEHMREGGWLLLVDKTGLIVDFAYHTEGEEKMREEVKRELDECAYDSPADFLWFYVLKGCVCGSSDEFKAEAWKVFEDFALDREEKWNLFENPVRELLAHWIGSCGLIEHGSTIRGSWLNEDGKELYQHLKDKPSN